MEIFLSIIIPVYNLENYIIRTLTSIINQIDETVEVIIIDDGSTDDSLKTINSFLDKNKTTNNIKLISTPNGGVSKARNIGISKSIGQYIYFIDGDDIVYDNLIPEILDILRSNNYDSLTAKYNKITLEGNIIYRFEDKYTPPSKYELTSNEYLEQCLLKNTVITIGTAFYKKEVIDKYSIKFDENEKYGEDVEFFFRFLGYSSNIYFLNKTLLGYTNRDGSAISLVNKNADIILKAYLKKMYSLKNELNNIVKNSKIINLFDSVLIPGLILSLSISVYSSRKKLPIEILKKLNKVTIKDTILKKDKRGIGLYLGSKILYLSPLIFKSLLGILKIKKRF